MGEDSKEDMRGGEKENIKTRGEVRKLERNAGRKVDSKLTRKVSKDVGNRCGNVGRMIASDLC